MRRDASMTLGVLPALGGSLTDFRRHGQLDRLVSYYFPAYLEAFPRVRFFSHEPERWEEFTEDAALRGGVEVVAPERMLPRRLAALALAAGPRRSALRDCAVVRVLQAPGALPAALAGAPYVCTYGYSYPQFTQLPLAGPFAQPVLAGKRTLMRVGLSALLRRAEATIVTTAAGEAEARSLGAKTVVRVPNGVDLEVFAPRGAPAEHDVAFVGRLTPQKDVPTLLRALAQLNGTRLVVVGDGPLRPELEAEARRLGLEARFLGAVGVPVVADVLARSRVFVLPSRFEGHPKALLEALAAGAACVGSDIDGIRELAADGAVELFPVGDAAALAAVLRALLLDDARRVRLATVGRALAAERFDLRPLLRAETRLLAGVAARRRPVDDRGSSTG
jgi:glycosyltransferase involved in cell wall biosynthesis